MAEKSYLDLKSEVWDEKKCSGCGACVAVCPADALSFAEGEMVVSPRSNGYCKQATDNVPCGACYAICPRVGDQPRDTLGAYLELLSAKAAFEIPHRQSGGAVTAILANALDLGLIDAVVTVTEDPWTLKPKSVVITKSDILIHEAGSRYSWWVPLLAALKEAAVTRKYTKIVVIGVPCAVQAAARYPGKRERSPAPVRKSDPTRHWPLLHGNFRLRGTRARQAGEALQDRAARDQETGRERQTGHPQAGRDTPLRPACRP